MKSYELKALEYSKKFETWDNQIIAKDAYLAAYKEALIDSNEYLSRNVEEAPWDLHTVVQQHEVDVDLSTHQILDSRLGKPNK
jgi:hypothetical protein